MSTVVDFSNLQKRFQKLAILEGKLGSEILKDQSRLLVRDLLKMTPPTSRSLDESFNDQRKRGIRRVKNDVYRLWRSAQGVAKMVRKGGNERAAKWLERYGRRGEVRKFEKMCLDLGIPQKVQLSVSEQEHDAKRNMFMNGRVMRREPQTIVLRERSIKQLLKTKMANVGTAKGGWVPAAEALGVPFPQWLKGHTKSQGMFDSNFVGPEKHITIGNLVAFAQKYAGGDRLIERAVKLRERYLDAYMKKKFKL